MVSWQNYVDFICSKGNIAQVIIVSSDTGYTWASTPGFQLLEYKAPVVQEDGSEVEEVINEASNLLKFMKGEKAAQGLRLNGGKKQQILRHFKDDGGTGEYMVYGKVTKGGCCAASAGKCIIIGTFDENANHTSVGCNEVIGLMAKYLIRSKWPVSLSQIGGNEESWKPYITDLLVGKGHVSEAIICSKLDGTIWGSSSPEFKFETYEAEIPQEDGSDRTETVNEAKNVIELMSGGPKPSQGLRLQSKKFQIVRSYNNDTNGAFTVVGKKTMGGCCIMASGKCIIVAVFEEKTNQTSVGCCEAVADVVSHLVAKGM